MLTVLSIFGIYLVGVLAALLVIAWVNTHGFGTGADEIPSVFGALSWITVCLIIIIFIAYPFSLFYDWCYYKFEKLLK
jgi:hypothetical protein